MIRRSRVTLSTLLGAVLAAALLAGCGTATSTAGRSAVPTPTSVGAHLTGPSAGTSVGASGSPRATGSGGASGSGSRCDPSALATDPLSLPHINARLEDLLPTIVGGVCLQKLSFTLQAYIDSTTGGDKGLYPAWLVKFDKTPSEVVIAIAADFTGQENFICHAIQIPGQDADTLSSSFAGVARNAGWPVTTHTDFGGTGKTLLEIIDPVAKAAGGLYAGYVYAKDDVLYTIITDDPALLLEALIHLP